MDPLAAARVWRQEGRYDLALATLREAAPGAAVLAEQARVQVRLGATGLALRLAREAVASAGEGAPALLGEALVALGEASLAAGELGEARAAAEEALSKVRAESGEISVPTALAMDLLAAVLHSGGDVPAALGLATRTVVVLEHLGADPYLQATAQHTLAEAWHRAGRYDEARLAWTRCLDLRRGALDAEHPEIAAALDGLGLTLRRLGCVREALAAHQSALALHRARLGPKHPALAACHHGLAQAHHRLGDFPRAREHLQRALAISEHGLGPDHTDTLVTRFELGRVAVDCGDLDGFGEMEAVRARLLDRLGATHPTVVAMGRWL